MEHLRIEQNAEKSAIKMVKLPKLMTKMHFLAKKQQSCTNKQDVDQKQGRILRNATVGHHLSCQPRRKNAKNDV